MLHGLNGHCRGLSQALSWKPELVIAPRCTVHTRYYQMKALSRSAFCTMFKRRLSMHTPRTRTKHTKLGTTSYIYIAQGLSDHQIYLILPSDMCLGFQNARHWSRKKHSGKEETIVHDDLLPRGACQVRRKQWWRRKVWSSIGIPFYNFSHGVSSRIASACRVRICIVY